VSIVQENRCPDCWVLPGEAHTNGCDVARCLKSGRQRIGCDSFGLDNADCGEDVWTGEWPGLAECREYGLWAKLLPGRGWVICGSSDSGATEDLNTLVSKGTWNRELRKWEIV
jgi:hypothetical protein